MAGNIRKNDKILINSNNALKEIEDMEFEELDLELLKNKEQKKLLEFKKIENKPVIKKKNNKIEKSKNIKEIEIGQTLIGNNEKEEKTKPKAKITKKKKEIKEVEIGQVLVGEEQNEKTKKVTTEKIKQKKKSKEQEDKKEKLKEKLEKIEKEQSSNNELSIRTNEQEKTVQIELKEKKIRIDIQQKEYDVYTNNSNSYIIAKQPRLEIYYGKSYIYITRKRESHIIETNQDVKLDYMLKNLVKRGKICRFNVSNLSEIQIDNENIIIKIDETKMIESKIQDNNTLLISEEKGKVFLPYTKEEIKKEIEETKNTNISEIIEKNYVLPIEKFKNSIRARFREGYNLMRTKENKTKKSAVMLGLELMFEFNLHPAIIAACKNLEQLDIYLDCLEDNELEKFSCFKIVYKSMPTIQTSKNKMQVY